MKKKFTKKIMDDVVSFEKKRTLSWILKYLFIIITLLVILSFSLKAGVQKILDWHSLDVFLLFQENTETIKEYWQDAFYSFWQELPKEELILSLTLLLIIACSFFLLRKKLKYITTKVINLFSYINN